jgi:DNA repair exonuclease SbcCD ATPase subunit
MEKENLLNDDEIDNKLDQLNQDYIDFQKYVQNLDELKDKINDNKNNYKNKKEEINNVLDNTEKKQNSLNDLYNELSNQDTSNKRIKKRMSRVLKNINTKFNEKKKMYENLKNDFNDLKNKLNFQEIEGENDSNTDSKNPSFLSGQSGEMDNKKMKYEEYNNDNLYKDRENEIKDVKGISQKLVEISNTMITKVEQQGDKLNTIEDNIIDVSENTKKAGEEVKKTEELTKKQYTRIFYLFIIIIILIIILYALFRQFNQKK